MTITEARKILGKLAAKMTDQELEEYLAKIQYLIDCWLDNAEKEMFKGKTINELINPN